MSCKLSSIISGSSDKSSNQVLANVSGSCPLTLQDCVEGNLLDYKIYGAEGGVGDQTENVFDKHYTLGYNGTAPNVAAAEGGLSTEWYDINDIGTDFTLAINPITAVSSIVVGYLQTNDKTKIELRRGFTNASQMTINTDNFSNFNVTNTNYKYVKFYVNNASLVNDIRIYKGLNNNLTVPYGFYFPIKVNDTEHKLLLDLNDSLMDGDYIDFENRIVVKDGVSSYVDLPEIPLVEGTNTFDVDTTVKPSNVSLTYVKSVEFNTMKTVEGTLPLTVEGVGQRLEGYRIYGAEGGVGDKSKNLCSGIFNVTTKLDEPIPAGTVISLSAGTKGYDASSNATKLRVRFVDSENNSIWNFYPTLVEAENRLKSDNLTLTKDVYGYWLTNVDVGDYQIEIGSVHTDYEPYGYRTEIKINEDITKIYLKEQLRIDDYIDFENRSIFIGGVLTHIDLPEIYLQNGQNIIDVDTAVKPSKVAVSFVDNDGGYDAGYAAGYEAMKVAVDMSDVNYRFNEEVTSYPSNWYRMALNFTDANGVEYKQIATFTSSGKINIQYTPVSGSVVTVYSGSNTPGWADEAYKIIHIKDGDMIGDIETFRWLINNGQFYSSSMAESLSPEICTFIYNGSEYEFEKGMTWKEFVESEYNPRIDSSTLEFSDIGDGLLHGDGDNLVAVCKSGSSTDELLEWTIVPNCSYEFN